MSPIPFPYLKAMFTRALADLAQTRQDHALNSVVFDLTAPPQAARGQGLIRKAVLRLVETNLDHPALPVLLPHLARQHHGRVSELLLHTIHEGPIERAERAEIFLAETLTRPRLVTLLRQAHQRVEQRDLLQRLVPQLSPERQTMLQDLQADPQVGPMAQALVEQARLQQALPLPTPRPAPPQPPPAPRRRRL